MSPLLDTTIQGARGIIFNITGDKTCGLSETEEAVKLIQSAADPQANIFIGADIDMSLEDEVRITVIATGFNSGEQEIEPPVAKVQSSPAQKSASQYTASAASPARNNRTPGEIVRHNIEDFGGNTPFERNQRLLDDEENAIQPIVFVKKAPKRLRRDD